jgi:pilus assembly protein Flp/PilA
MYAWSDIAKQLLRDGGGVTSIGYRLIGSPIAATILDAVATPAGSVGNLHQRIATQIATARGYI